MKKLQGFTLSEILIALLVLGIIVAASVPVILNLSPNKNGIMMKKAYYATETVIQALINDSTYYPAKDGTVGFDNRDEVVSPFDSGKKINGNAKFPCLFASKLNIKDDLATVCTGTTSPDTVTTMDGMTWNLQGLQNLGNTSTTNGTIEIDVDGIDNGVSAYNGTTLKACTSKDTWGSACNSEPTARQTKKFDRISITITPDGQLKVLNQEAFTNILNGKTKLIGGDDD